MPDIGERRLATIRRVSKIEPIPGADRIVKATIDGWELVTQKGNYEPGDLCLYFEIDSFLPVRPEFEFLRKGCFKSTTNLGDGFRIKTIKLKGQVSQGLSLPMKDFFANDERGWYYNDHDAGYFTRVDLVEGMDLTEYFKVQKYEKPISGPGGSRLGPMNARGSFPPFLQKTDQERIQNCFEGIKKWIYYGKPEVTEVTDQRLIASLEDGFPEHPSDSFYFKSGDQWFHKHWLRNDEETIEARRKFEVTLKLDGSSMTVYHHDHGYGVCSRNYDLKRDPESVFWSTALHTGVFSPLVEDGRSVALQGELMGPGVQRNREELKGHTFYVFDVYLVDESRYMTPVERDVYVGNLMGETRFSFDHAPIKEQCFVWDEDETTVASLLEMAKTESIKHPVAEGLVFKSFVEGGPSFKVINTTYLLNEKD